MGGKKKSSKKSKEKGKVVGGGSGGRSHPTAENGVVTSEPEPVESMSPHEIITQLVEAHPSHKVFVAAHRKLRTLADLTIQELENLQYSARVGMPSELDKYRAVSALVRAGTAQPFFEHNDALNKEYSTNPFCNTTMLDRLPAWPDGECIQFAPPPEKCTERNEDGVPYIVINHILEVMYLSGTYMSLCHIIHMACARGLEAHVSQAVCCICCPCVMRNQLVSSHVPPCCSWLSGVWNRCLTASLGCLRFVADQDCSH